MTLNKVTGPLSMGFDFLCWKQTLCFITLKTAELKKVTWNPKHPTHFPSSWEPVLNISWRCHPQEVWNMLLLLPSVQLITQTGRYTGHAEGWGYLLFKDAHCNFLPQKRSRNSFECEDFVRKNTVDKWCHF